MAISNGGYSFKVRLVRTLEMQVRSYFNSIEEALTIAKDENIKTKLNVIMIDIRAIKEALDKLDISSLSDDSIIKVSKRLYRSYIISRDAFTQLG